MWCSVMCVWVGGLVRDRSSLNTAGKQQKALGRLRRTHQKNNPRAARAPSWGVRTLPLSTGGYQAPHNNRRRAGTRPGVWAGRRRVHKTRPTHKRPHGKSPTTKRMRTNSRRRSNI